VGVSTTSIPALVSELFAFEIETSIVRFNSDGWSYDGLIVIRPGKVGE
jgi:hypothetical protein